MSKTTDNLQTAFAGESQANRKYLFFAEKADQEGLKQVARLFRAAAEAETVHARNHLKVLGGIKSSLQNLKAAVAGENYEFTKMYPDFIKQSEVDKQSDAGISFYRANKVEEIHHGLFGAFLKKLEGSQPAADKPFYVCQVCGNTVEGEAPDKCPVCGATKSMFRRVD